MAIYRPVKFQKSCVSPLRAKVERELGQLMEQEIIERVEGPTPWVSPIVPAPKPKTPDEVRLCTDMRAANKAIMRERHITPTVDDMVGELHGCKVFSRIELRKGYLQLELAEESRYITTFTMHKGLFRYKCLSFGINSASEIFQDTVSQTRAGIPNTVNISDDIILGGKDRKEHNEKLIKLQTRLYEDGFTINLPKCLFGVTKLDFYGLVFSEEGISPDPQKVEDLKKLAVPRNSEELQSLIGMLGFSSRFIPNYSTLTDPLRQLIKKNAKWVWGKERSRC